MQKLEPATLIHGEGDGDKGVCQRVDRLDLRIVIGARARTVGSRIGQSLLARICYVFGLRLAFDIEVIRCPGRFEYLCSGVSSQVDGAVDMLCRLTAHRCCRGRRLRLVRLIAACAVLSYPPREARNWQPRPIELETHLRR